MYPSTDSSTAPFSVSLARSAVVPFFGAEHYVVPGDVRNTHATHPSADSNPQHVSPTILEGRFASGTSDGVYGGALFKKPVALAQMSEPGPGQWQSTSALCKKQSQSNLSVKSGRFNHADAQKYPYSRGILFVLFSSFRKEGWILRAFFFFPGRKQRQRCVRADGQYDHR